MRKDWCKYHNGTQNKVCEAGVCYKDVIKEGEPAGPYKHTKSLPCIGKYNLHGATCEKLLLPTEEEISQDEAEHHDRMANVVKARQAIFAHAGPYRKGEGKRGVIDCPCCGKASGLHYSRAGYNGHVHASCETDGCVSWIE